MSVTITFDPSQFAASEGQGDVSLFAEIACVLFNADRADLVARIATFMEAASAEETERCEGLVAATAKTVQAARAAEQSAAVASEAHGTICRIIDRLAEWEPESRRERTIRGELLHIAGGGR